MKESELWLPEIWIADDEKSIRLVLSECLKAFLQKDCKTFDDGLPLLEEYIRIVESEGKYPELILTDLHMKRMDGDTLSKCLRLGSYAKQEFQRYPGYIVMMNPEGAYRESGRKYVDVFVEKFDLVRDAGMLNEYLSRKSPKYENYP